HYQPALCSSWRSEEPLKLSVRLGGLKNHSMLALCSSVLHFALCSLFVLEVVEVSTSKIGKHGHAKCHFVAIDIFKGSMEILSHLPITVMYVPHVSRTDYQLIDISKDGFVSLLTENGNTKDDLKLPTDDALLTQVLTLI
ncbi:hypothetical protein M8C21_020475, partial [Ambrosia artemisiifolia]